MSLKIQNEPMLYDNAKYFILKSENIENLIISQAEGVWATTFQPTKKLSAAFQKFKNVILIYSVTTSSAFQGYARMKSMPSPTIKEHIFKRTDTSFPYQDNFEVEWIVKDVQLLYRQLSGFPPNPLNEGYAIMQSKNGQELLPEHGNYLVSLLHK